LIFKGRTTLLAPGIANADAQVKKVVQYIHLALVLGSDDRSPSKRLRIYRLISSRSSIDIGMATTSAFPVELALPQQECYRS
jgi:hypothetical protein